MNTTSRARLLNADHELIAEGTCVLDEPAGQASLEVERTMAAVQGQSGNLSLELDSGRSLLVTNKPILMTITPPGQRPTPENRRRIYRLRLVDPMAALRQQDQQQREDDTERGPAQSEGTGPGSTHIAQDASAVGAVGEGRPTASIMGRLSVEGREETPTAR